jgi:hypothetical protein
VVVMLLAEGLEVIGEKGTKVRQLFRLFLLWAVSCFVTRMRLHAGSVLAAAR